MSSSAKIDISGARIDTALLSGSPLALLSDGDLAAIALGYFRESIPKMQTAFDAVCDENGHVLWRRRGDAS